MLDVGALLAARGGRPEGGAPREVEARAEVAREAEAREGVEAREAPVHVGPATRAVPLSAGARGAGWIRLAGIAVVIVLVVAGVLLLLPMIVRDRIVASAREAGVELTVERVGVSLSGISMRGVVAKSARAPGLEARADEIFTSGFSAREVRVRGLDVKLAGNVTDVAPNVLALYRDNRARIAGTASEPRKVSIVSAHVAWDGVLGEGTHLEAAGLGADVESRGVGTEDIRASVGQLDVKTPRTTFGPWAGSFDRSASTSRLRILFDPPVPDGPSALLVWVTGLPPRLTVRVPRSPFARLGVRPQELGLPADATTEVEVKIEGGQSPSTRLEGSGRIDVYGARLQGLEGPLDLTIEGAASGLPGKPLDLVKTTMTLGPFVANLTGTITPTDAGFALDAAWRTNPIPCDKLARAEASSLGPIAAALHDIARSTGVARVTGTAHGSGLVKYDTRTPDQGTVTFVTHQACGLSLFGN